MLATVLCLLGARGGAPVAPDVVAELLAQLFQTMLIEQSAVCTPHPPPTCPPPPASYFFHRAAANAIKPEKPWGPLPTERARVAEQGIADAAAQVWRTVLASLPATAVQAAFAENGLAWWTLLATPTTSGAPFDLGLFRVHGFARQGMAAPATSAVGVALSPAERDHKRARASVASSAPASDGSRPVLDEIRRASDLTCMGTHPASAPLAPFDFSAHAREAGAARPAAAQQLTPPVGRWDGVRRSVCSSVLCSQTWRRSCEAACWPWRPSPCSWRVAATRPSSGQWRQR